jgi:predicted HAD superfamily Cof-like phosphohydrolase
MSHADLVSEFHRTIGGLLPDRPTAPSIDGLTLWETLVREEFTEVEAEYDAMRGRLAEGDEIRLADLAALGHELVDLLYVAYGALLTLGLPVDAIFDEIHRANLAKASGPVRNDGKQLKPPNWRPPDVLGLLERLARRTHPAGPQSSGL